jgi:NAD(P)-dependent dehydrogenase (short-subunit alcohol dehydrogenase family)
MDLGLAGRVGVMTGAGGEVGAATTRLLRAEGAETREVAPEELVAIGGAIGGVDFLVNFAGAPAGRHAAPGDDLRAQFERGVMAPMRAMKALAPVLAERGHGRIVNVCPTAQPVAAAAESSLSRLFSDRYAKQGVLVNVVRPAPGADPEATAREIAFLCSERASHVSGATWPVGASTAGVTD